MAPRRPLSRADWLQRERGAGRLTDELSPGTVMFLVDLCVRVAERDELTSSSARLPTGATGRRRG
jgi:hypothetical protein